MRALDDSYLRIAKCGRTIGLKGEIVLWPISNVEQRYLVGSIFVDKNGNEFTIDKIRPLKDQYVVKFKGFDNIEQVKKFVNIEFFGEPLTADVLDEGEYFAHDVLGKIIKDSSNIEHGIVKDVIPNAASDLLENDNGNLIPFRFIESFDDKYVYIDPPEGLFELD
ncbi:MAG: 16S rRNA processing protein RimM [Acidimicrobiia bacterium]|nr:16S rRNA processing protein RimM [Acidimicrobiia bacterium]